MEEENKNTEPVNSPAGNIPEEIIPGERIPIQEEKAPALEELQTTNDKQQTDKQMEVHHPHHVHHSKKWKDYLFEFLMLFLAVTMGFFVENQREHYIEHQRAKVYAKAMLADLQADVEELKRIESKGEFAVNYLDSFLNLVSGTDFRQVPTGKLYFLGLWGGYLRGFAPNDATFQQMKNSGSLRYFNNHSLEQKIGNYDQLQRSIHMLNEIDMPIYLETRKARARIFDFQYNKAANEVVQSAVYANYNPAVIDSFCKTNPPLLTNDKIIFNEYVELCRSRNLRQQQNNTKNAIQLASDIIKDLKNEYHLE